MSNHMEIASEVVRLAQHRVRSTGTPLAPELARLIVEEAVFAVDPGSGCLVDLGAAYAVDDGLVQALGVNDVVVNDTHLDVRVLDDAGSVSISRSLVGTSYLAWGSAVVRLDGISGGIVVGYVPASAWEASANADSTGSVVRVNVDCSSDLDIGVLFGKLASQPVPEHSSSEPRMPDSAELARFIAGRNEIELSRQKEIVEMLLNNIGLREELSYVTSLWSDGTLSRILCAASVWNSRVERLVEKLAPSFPVLKHDDIRKVVMRTGEAFGGQPESPQFRKALLSSLGREELIRSVRGADITKLAGIVEKVLSGSSTVDTVKGLVKNKVVMDLAVTIKDSRKKVAGFVAATADEVGMAFQQLSLQPAYATHSQEPEAGMESINEALQMLEAGEIAEKITELDKELSGF